RREKNRRAERYEAPVHRHALLRHERHAERAAHPARIGRLAKEHVARVHIERVLQLHRIRRRPALYALHRGLLERELAALHEVAAERAVGMAVLIGIREAYALAAFELELARALDLQEEKLDRVRGPADHRCAEAFPARFDLGAAVVRHEAPALEAAAQPEIPHLRCHGPEIDHEQVVGDAEHRDAIRRVAYAAASHNGLVIAGDDAGVASLGAHQRVRREGALKEATRARFVAYGDRGRRAASAEQ